MAEKHRAFSDENRMRDDRPRLTFHQLFGAPCVCFGRAREE
jgi:hypothetical protein